MAQIFILMIAFENPYSTEMSIKRTHYNLRFRNEDQPKGPMRK